MNEQELSEIEDRCNKATPGPWVDCGDQLNAPNATVIDHEWAPPVPGHEDDDYPITVSREDADFIANARDDVPRLLSVIKKQADILREIVSFKYRECDCPNIGIYLELHGADSSVIERAKALLDDE